MKWSKTVLALVVFTILSCGSVTQAVPTVPALGHPPSEEALASRQNLVFPDGTGLPPGRGDVAMGRALYGRRCLACHGTEGRGGTGGELAGGNPDLTAPQPDKTIGTYWPFATTLFDFIRRAM
ncbi:MAG: c-type cytochrome, partial [Gammaproteobacteria bacterium]